jgi:hypothetical protein
MNMDTQRTGQRSLHITEEKLLAFVRSMIGGRGGREDDEHPLPPGPWDPVIRVALEQVSGFGPRPEPWYTRGQGVPWRSIQAVYGPLPDPWKVVFSSIFARHPEIFDVIGGGHSFGDEVALNPQPLPPRTAFLLSAARTVASRAELFQEMADATRREGEQHGIIIVGGYTRRFSDDWCGTQFRLKWPFPGPRPHWYTDELHGTDLLVLASQFAQLAKEAFSPDLRQNLADAAAKFAETGLSRM